MKKLKVLVAMEKLSNLNSGLGQFCLGLGNAMASKEKSLADISFLVPASARGIFGNNVNYTLLKSYVSFLWNKPKAFDIWHCTHQQSKYVPVKCKLVLTIHDLNFLYKYKGFKKKWKLNALQQKVNKASAIVAISKFTASEIKEHLTVDENKLHVIYNGVNIRNTAKTELPEYLKGQKYLFSIGIINHKKNFHVLLPLLQNNADLKLVIAGNDSHVYVNQIKTEAHKMGIIDRVYFTGMIDDNLKFELYKNCYAFVFPSLSEGFGLPVIEAMHFGKPVFLSNLTCLPEIGGKEAFYWNSFDAKALIEIFENGMKAFENDYEKPDRLKAHASNFSWEKAAEAYLNLYEKI